jgi:DNA-binding SARP family transcriptional activator
LAEIQVYLFGKLKIEQNGHCVEGFESKKAQDLLCYLLLYNTRPHPREKLAGLIWGEQSTLHAKKYLRQALWLIQSTLSSKLKINEGRLLSVNQDWIQLNPEADVWMDISEFERVYRCIQEIHAYNFEPGLYEALKRVVDLYQGDLCEDCFEDWCIFERERFQNMHLTLLEKLVGYCEHHAKYLEALQYCERVLRIDGAHERTHRRMIRMYYALGKRTSALRQYERCVVALRQELGVAPSWQTVDLYEQVCRDEPVSAHPTPVVPIRPPDSTEIHIRLQQLRHSLDEFYKITVDEIEALEKTLQENQPINYEMGQSNGFSSSKLLPPGLIMVKKIQLDGIGYT